MAVLYPLYLSGEGNIHVEDKVVTIMSPYDWSRLIIINSFKINSHIINLFVISIFPDPVPIILVNFIRILDKCIYLNTILICRFLYP